MLGWGDVEQLLLSFPSATVCVAGAGLVVRLVGGVSRPVGWSFLPTFLFVSQSGLVLRGVVLSLALSHLRSLL